MPAADLNAPLVCCLPHTPAALAKLARYCETLALPAPQVWDDACRPRTIRDLLTTAAERPSLPPLAVPLPASVVVLHGVPVSQVRALMRACREDGAPRPIFAITTPTSLEFTLEALLTHLLQDRAREDAQRAAGASTSG